MFLSSRSHRGYGADSLGAGVGRRPCPAPQRAYGDQLFPGNPPRAATVDQDGGRSPRTNLQRDGGKDQGQVTAEPTNPQPFQEGDHAKILYSPTLGVFTVQGCWRDEDTGEWYCVARNAHAGWQGPAGQLVRAETCRIHRGLGMSVQ